MAATLLLADDSVTIQRVIELTFADEDVTVIAVSDGDAAIARVEADLPDIVLADVGMPGKNGYEVASYIKHSPRLSHIPVLLLTGAFEPVDRDKAKDAGCDGVLAKPFEPQLVINRVLELLGRRSAAAMPGAAAPSAIPVPVGDRALPEPPFVRAAPEERPLERPAPGGPLDRPAPGGPLERPAPGDTTGEALGDYFDQLDAAFSKLPGARTDIPIPDDGLSLGELGGDLEADLPLSFASARSDFDRLPPPHPAMPETPRQPAAPSMKPAMEPVSPSRSPASPTQAMPALADAFAALLAAEQPGAAPADTAAWVPSPAPPVGTDDLVERVTKRVIERLSDRVVRETVTELVSDIAERLVREEIDRIKGAIK